MGLWLDRFWRACILGALGDRAKAVESLRRASEQGQSMANWHADPRLAAMWDFPLFRSLVWPAI